MSILEKVGDNIKDCAEPNVGGALNNMSGLGDGRCRVSKSRVKSEK